MTYPKTYFSTTPDAERPGTCFVLMPFSPELEAVYRVIRDALQSPEVGFRCGRADELFGGDQIMSGVPQEMARAELIIGDLTGRNPNVFYELGLAHMTKNAERVLLLTQRIDDVPFDLRAYRYILYQPDEPGLRTLREQVTNTARAVAGRTYRFTLTQGENHKTQPLFPGDDRHLYSVEVSEAMIGYGFVKCRVCVYQHAIGSEPKVVEDSGYGFNEGESREIDHFPWAIRLDSATDVAATFSVVPIGTGKQPTQN